MKASPPPASPQGNEIFDQIATCATEVVSQIPATLDSIQSEFKKIDKQQASLTKKIKMGARKTDGNGSFLL